ncbi:MAG: hypothetical protein SGPRY_003749 [Prymnesium sp.]
MKDWDHQIFTLHAYVQQLSVADALSVLTDSPRFARLRCGQGISATWTEFVDLPYEERLFRETRSVTCKRGLVATGMRVYRGFQNWGDIDTYELQLFCAPNPMTSEQQFDKGEL